MDDTVFLVEGSDDERFVNRVLEPEMDYATEVIKYSQKPNDAVDNMLEVFDGVYQGHYFVTDLDRGQQDCHDCDDREAYERERYDIRESFRILVAVDAVEGWYLAGVPDELANERSVYPPESTEHVGKDEFDEVYVDSEYTSKEYLKTEIVDNFDYELARRRNDSFRYVCDVIGV